MNNIKSVVLTVIFGVIWEYLTVPATLGFLMTVVFANADGLTFGLNVIQVVAGFVWARFLIEFLVKAIAGVWYGEKYSRQK